MPRARDPNRDKSFEIWKQQKGKITNRAIAEQLGVPEKTIGAWKSKDKWIDMFNGVLQTKIRSTPKKKKLDPVIESDELNEKQKLFCIYYLKSFNATKAYLKAYGCAYTTAAVEGHRHLKNPKMKSEIDRLKAERQQELHISGEDIIQKYIDIAFADITDFATFGKKEVEAMGAFGPLKDEEDNPIMVEINYVDFKDSLEVDGTIITEVKKGKDGVSVKLADKMKALDMLTKYFDFLPEHQKRRLEEEKVKVEIEKIQGDKGASEDWVAALKEVAEKRKQVKVNE
jgi:phage terminase small subunit